MTTRALRISALLLALLLCLGACFGGRAGHRGGLPSDQVERFPREVRDAYQLFAYKCSRCHTLARPLNAGITDFEHWRSYVARMRRQAGSGISEQDGEVILVFLKYYAAEKAREAGTFTSTTGGGR